MRWRRRRGCPAVTPAQPSTRYLTPSPTPSGTATTLFTGFGKFHTTRRAAREGVNPRNPSQKVYIPAATVPKFSAGSQLKKAVN